MRIRRPGDLGPLVHARRRSLGWSQARLAALAGVGRQWLVEVERGKREAPIGLVIKTLGALGYALDVSDDTSARVPTNSGPNGRSVIEASLSRKGDDVIQPGEPQARPHLKAPTEGRTVQQPKDPCERSGQPDLGTYELANFEAIGIPADRDQLYELDYRAVLRLMATHVVLKEAPIFEDLLARRIARAHGLARTTSKLLQITRKLVDQKFPRTTEDERIIIWPEKVDVEKDNDRKLVPFRSAPLEDRDHTDIPREELASLAVPYLTDGYTADETVVLMSSKMGLKRIASTTRSRLLKATELAYEMCMLGPQNDGVQ
jgi:y4mF family transcriptional regulator